MPTKTLKPHTGTVIGKPRPGDTASTVGFLRPVVQKTDTTKTYTANIHPIKAPTPTTTTPTVKTSNAKPVVMSNKTDSIKIDEIKPNTVEQISAKTVTEPEKTTPNTTITQETKTTTHDNNNAQRYIMIENQTPLKVCEPVARMGEAYANHIMENKFKIGDFVAIRKNGVILDSGEISLICVDMYFVETKKLAPRFWFGTCLEKIVR